MSGVPLETCWAFNECWNNKFCYKVASCWLFLLNHTTMHGSINIKYPVIIRNNQNDKKRKNGMRGIYEIWPRSWSEMFIVKPHFTELAADWNGYWRIMSLSVCGLLWQWYRVMLLCTLSWLPENIVKVFDQLRYTQMSKSMHHVVWQAKSNTMHLENTCTSDLIAAHFCALLSPFLFSSLLKYSAYIFFIFVPCILNVEIPLLKPTDAHFCNYIDSKNRLKLHYTLRHVSVHTGTILREFPSA
jgi:hypothetical protein